MKPFAIGNAGRFVYVDTYTKTRDHCMKMDVEIKTKVEHPEQNGAVHQHDSPRSASAATRLVRRGRRRDARSRTTSTRRPSASSSSKSQTTSGMGVHPNDDGHKCISDLIWEADTIEPGVTPLKWKLSIPEAPNSDICQ